MCDTSRARSPLLSTASLTAVTVTVCAVSQLVELKVSDEGDMVRAPESGLLTITVTSSVGWELRTSVYVAVGVPPGFSVTVRASMLTVIPAVSSSVMLTVTTLASVTGS